jgi:hypothetical protein
MNYCRQGVHAVPHGTASWHARHPASTAESAQDSPTYHAGGDAVSQHGLAGFAGRHAGRRAEHLAR